MPHVFEDPSGNRRKHLFRVAGLSALVLSIVATLFGISLALVPLIAPAAPKPVTANRSFPETLVLSNRSARQRAELQAHRAQVQQRRRAQQIAAAEARRARGESSAPLTVAFFAPWEDSGVESFRAHAPQIDVVIPAWLRLGDDGLSIDERDFDPVVNPRNKSLMDSARQNGVAVMPLISNAKEGVFDPKTVGRLLHTSHEQQHQFVLKLATWVKAHDFQGLNIDFELIPENEWPLLARFYQDLSAELHKNHLVLSSDLEAFFSPKSAAPVVDACDWVVIMAYDEHSEESKAGPLASRGWTNDVWDRWTRVFPANKLVTGTGSYGYDWKAGASTAESLSFDGVMSAASGYREGESPRSVIHVDPDSRNPWFVYDDENNVRHTVWFLDAVTAYNQWRPAQRAGARGFALWVLGNEDPAIWTFLQRTGTPGSKAESQNFDPSKLAEVSFPYEVDFRGKGEILRVAERPQAGRRTIDVDPATGDIRNWTYESYAFPFLLEKSGYKPKELVLTFDDGPDPKYTPQIVEQLKKLGVPGTFFMIGQEVVRHPGLVSEVWNAGFEIGSHSYTHPDLGVVNERRALLELNATQRALEALLGHSTRLFRPPYNADSQPETAAQVRPVEIADRLQYITVGENVDPNDWNLTQLDQDGTVRRKTAHDIASAVIQDVESRQGSGDEGNIILLHDAGGDRSATVAALPEMVNTLRAHGYRFVTVGDLLGRSRASLMPELRESDLRLVGIDRIVFRAASWAEAALRLLFFAGIVIGVGRALFIAVLAWANRTPRVFDESAASHLKTGVLIAAWNEENVIAATLRSVLASSHPLHEVIVIDDGSTDDTSGAVEREFGQDKRVRLIRKPNGGKASALNVGYRSSESDILVCVDADTVLHPAAVGLLLRHFDKENIGAVAGNVRVGNSDNLLTRWQSLEYTTSQNLDRRANELLNCITVVPGAIGAWRRSAVLSVGGYDVDTLAEDMDLTWRLRLAGYRIENETSALSFTEAPQSTAAFFKQRFRWAYGTLQCLWKHRAALGRHGWFGRFALPQLWLFQVVFQVLAPLIDITVAATIIGAVWVMLASGGSSTELDRLTMMQADLFRVLGSYGLFYAVEMAAAFMAYTMERRPKRDLWFLFLQRLAYRQVMYAVIWKALWRAMGGGSAKWGKLRRLGTARAEAA